MIYFMSINFRLKTSSHYVNINLFIRSPDNDHKQGNDIGID